MDHSGENLLNNPGGPIVGDDLFLSIRHEHELLVIQAKLVHQCCLKVVWRHYILDRAVAEFVGLAECHAATNAASGKPDAETLSVVVPSIFLRTSLVLGDRETTNLAAPVNNRCLQQTTLFQVCHQSCRGPVRLTTDRREGRPQIAVIVPGLSAVE